MGGPSVFVTVSVFLMVIQCICHSVGMFNGGPSVFVTVSAFLIAFCLYLCDEDCFTAVAIAVDYLSLCVCSLCACLCVACVCV